MKASQLLIEISRAVGACQAKDLEVFIKQWDRPATKSFEIKPLKPYKNDQLVIHSGAQPDEDCILIIPLP